MKIVAFHIYNDYSGSPKVLSMVLRGLLSRGYNIDLLTSVKGGALDELEDYKNIHIYRHYYKFGRNKIIQFCRYLYTQIYAFIFVFRYFSKKDIVLYLNTIMPIGAALAGKITRKRVIYHYHENAHVKGIFYKVLTFIMQKLADDVICVSEYQRSFLKRKKNIYVIPNALPIDFENKCEFVAKQSRDRKTVLMLSSLKLYKGVIEFIRLSQLLPQYKFELVINDTNENIDKFIHENNIEISENLKVWDRQTNVLPFYERSSLVVNMSNKKMFVETFGLTALEAMTAGIPVIVPTVGGIAEMVTDGYNGYKVDAEDLNNLKEKIQVILDNKKEYEKLRKNAMEFATKFSNIKMINCIVNVLNIDSNE